MLTDPTPPSAAPAHRDAAEVVSRALDAVLVELGRLAVQHGIPYGRIEEAARRAMVDAARDEPTDRGRPAPISQLSVMTGLHRREVKRLAEAGARRRAPARSLPAELVTRWLSEPTCLDAQGRPRTLPRRARGEGASFDALARAVTRDVSPRTLLDALVDVGLVEVSADGASVSLRLPAYLPGRDPGAVLALARANLVDHLAAVRENLDAIARSPDDAARAAPRLEQAVFADALSAESAAVASGLATEAWLRVLRRLGPALLELEARARSRGDAPTHRVRIGVYAYAAPNGGTDEGSPSSDGGARS